MTPGIITLTSDFGLRDPYVGEMKAVILGVNPRSVIVDITHEIEKFNVKMGAVALAFAAPYFPKGTVHVAVVDPGVGTKRRPLLIQTKQGFLVGPDNGLLALASKSLQAEHAYEITNQRLMLRSVSVTFHGRDVFAPAAAFLTKGISPAEFGPEIQDAVVPEFARIIEKKGVIVGEVLQCDDFGNVITNIGKKELESLKAKNTIKVKFRENVLELGLLKTYADAEPQESLALVGSHNFLEIAVNLGNAARLLKLKIGDRITLYRS
jgi:S-adenosylmethionine hydrolase